MHAVVQSVAALFAKKIQGPKVTYHLAIRQVIDGDGGTYASLPSVFRLLGLALKQRGPAGGGQSLMRLGLGLGPPMLACNSDYNLYTLHDHSLSARLFCQ